MKKALFITALACLLAACGPRKTAEVQKESLRPFPVLTSVPSVYQDAEEIADYVLEHFWDAFFSEGGRNDTSAILGVATKEVEQALSNFISILPEVPMPRAQKAVGHLFDQISAAQQADTSSHVYTRMTEMVANYLYDPNSPLRSEDYYLPFVKALAASPLTGEDYRPGYEYQARMCSLNQYGQKVPDFTFRDIKGRNHTLYGVKAYRTMLFFSNPGCHACKGIIEEVMSRPYMEEYLRRGVVAVVNVYIDEELDKWREYAPTYPKSWLSGYDYRFKIRSDEEYNVRAIPSLYLLDSEKRVLMKDVPTERVLAFLDRLQPAE